MGTVFSTTYISLGADELQVRRLNIRGVRRREREGGGEGERKRRGIVAGLYLDSFQSVSDFLASFFSRTKNTSSSTST